MSVEWRGLGPDDVQAWSDLTVALAEADETGQAYGLDELAEELDEPGVDPSLDIPGVFVDGRLIAYAQVRVSSALSDGRARAGIGGGVHPDFRGQGFGRRLMDLAEARAGLLAGQRHPGVPVELRVSGAEQSFGLRRLLGRRGYEVGRYFLEMERELPGPALPEAVVPDGFRVMGAASVPAENLRVAHNAAFADHWGSTARSVQEWQTVVGSSTFRPRDSFACVSADGEVVSYCCSYEEQPGQLTLGQIGTLPSWRGRGLARACVVRVLQSAASGQGYQLAKLLVDSQNPTSAGELYKSLGFETVRTVAVFTRTV